MDNQQYVLTVDSQNYALSMARTGGQGSKGNSVTNAVINSENDLIITVTDALGNTAETINAGSLTPQIEEILAINALSDVTITDVADGDIIQYDGNTSQFVNHTLTTSKVIDIDNTNKEDGALLVYNGTTTKYTATTAINNPNTTITGGSF